MTATTIELNISPSENLARYLRKIRKFPVLELKEEFTLAKNWREHKDHNAAHKLITSHLRLVAKIAVGYRGYGLPLGELIAEGNVGMVQAVTRFDPEKGFRLATYAMWWIRAAIQEYILHSWSLVKIGTTAAQKKLFFNLRKLKNKMQTLGENDILPENVTKIANKLNVLEKEVVHMNCRFFSPDHSLNAPIYEENNEEWQDRLIDEKDDQETSLAKQQEHNQRCHLLARAIGVLNERERHIFTARRLAETPLTLENLSRQYGVSRERVRQIEVQAFQRVQKSVRNAAINWRSSM